MRLLLLLVLFGATVSNAITSSCVIRADLPPPELTEQELDRAHALNIVQNHEPLPDYCSDPRYQQFLQALVAALGSGTGGLPVVRIIVLDQPGLLERRHYYEDFDAICHDCPYYPFTYGAGLDAGEKLGVLLREQVRPHHLRLEQVRNEFRSLAGEDFQVRDSSVRRLSDAEFFAAIEANAQTLLRELKSLPAEQLEDFRATHPRVRMLPTLTVDAFGAAGELRPMQEISTTLRKLYLPSPNAPRG